MEHIKLNLFAFGGEAGAGVTAADAGQQSAEGQVAAARDLDAEFDNLIRGDYKDQYNKRVADTIQKRLKGTKETVDRYNKLAPALETLASRYHLKSADDIDGIVKALDEDNSFIEEEALERGVSFEQMKEIRRMERENKQLRAEMDRRNTEDQVKKQYAEWLKQSEETQKFYPNFSIDDELQNDQFRSLLNAGVDVKTAFEVVHQKEIMPQMMQFGVQQGAARAANAVIANGYRPTENGSRSMAAVSTKITPSSLTKAQIEEIISRAARGEKITF